MSAYACRMNIPHARADPEFEGATTSSRCWTMFFCAALNLWRAHQTTPSRALYTFVLSAVAENKSYVFGSNVLFVVDVYMQVVVQVYCAGQHTAYQDICRHSARVCRLRLRLGTLEKMGGRLAYMGRRPLLPSWNSGGEQDSRCMPSTCMFYRHPPTNICICIHRYVYVYTCTYTYLCIYKYMHTHICIYICVCTCLWVCMRIHADTCYLLHYTYACVTARVISATILARAHWLDIHVQIHAYVCKVRFTMQLSQVRFSRVRQRCDCNLASIENCKRSF